MKILITGHKGFIGSYIANYLATKDHEVEGFEWVENVVPNVEGYDWVIHCGAISDTPRSPLGFALPIRWQVGGCA